MSEATVVASAFIAKRLNIDWGSEGWFAITLSHILGATCQAPNMQFDWCWHSISGGPQHVYDTVDGRNPAPPKKPRNDDSLVNTNNPWFQPWFHFVVRSGLRN